MSAAAPADARRPWWVPLVVCAGVVVGAAVTFGVAFPTRTDYLGHFVAGAGGTLLGLAPALALSRARSWWRAAIVVAAVAAGVVTEATVFKIAIFDPVDLANQSLGAVLAGAALLDSSRSWLLAAGTAVLGVCSLVAGFHYAFA